MNARSKSSMLGVLKFFCSWNERKQYCWPQALCQCTPGCIHTTFVCIVCTCINTDMHASTQTQTIVKKNICQTTSYPSSKNLSDRILWISFFSKPTHWETHTHTQKHNYFYGPPIFTHEIGILSCIMPWIRQNVADNLRNVISVHMLLLVSLGWTHVGMCQDGCTSCSTARICSDWTASRLCRFINILNIISSYHGFVVEKYHHKHKKKGCCVLCLGKHSCFLEWLATQLILFSFPHQWLL